MLSSITHSAFQTLGLEQIYSESSKLFSSEENRDPVSISNLANGIAKLTLYSSVLVVFGLIISNSNKLSRSLENCESRFRDIQKLNISCSSQLEVDSKLIQKYTSCNNKILQCQKEQLESWEKHQKSYTLDVDGKWQRMKESSYYMLKHCVENFEKCLK